MKKNIIIFHPTDRGACSWYRMKFMAMILMSGRAGEIEVVVSPFEITDGPTLSRTAAIVVNRVYDDETGVMMVRHYKRWRGKYGYRVFVDYDDIFFDVDGRSIMTEYNPLPIDSAKAGEYMAEVVGGVDGVTVSTAFIKGAMEKRFGWKNVVLLPNSVPRFVFGRNYKNECYDPYKPLVLYAGSFFHFKDGHVGDFEGPWVEWLKKSVVDGTIDLHLFQLPWFLEDVKDRITVHEGVSAVEFPSKIVSIGPDIYLAPLQANDFNRGKSNLKMLEATAVGAALMGSAFAGSPYMEAHPYSLVWEGMTPELLREQFGFIVESFKEVVEHQRRVMDEKGYWTDSRHYMTRFLKIFFGDSLVEH